MKVRALDVHRKSGARPPIKIRLPRPLYRRVEQTARASGCDVDEVIVSTLEDRLVPLSPGLSPDLSVDLQRWAMLDDEALLAIANGFLPAKEQRRYVTLLRKANTGRLKPGEHPEWEALQQEYLRFSRNKAKAQYLLMRRKEAGHRRGASV